MCGAGRVVVPRWAGVGEKFSSDRGTFGLTWNVDWLAISVNGLIKKVELMAYWGVGRVKRHVITWVCDGV